MAKVEEMALVRRLEWETPLVRTALAQFEQARPPAAVGDAVAARLRSPGRSLMVTASVRLDDGSPAGFPAFPVQHSTTLGPTKDGVRYDPRVSLGGCAAVALWMPWKCALLRLPYGRAKGDLRGNPCARSPGELKRLARRYTAELAPVREIAAALDARGLDA